MSALGETFQKNLTDGREVGAGLSIFRGAREIVSLSGGFCDAARTIPWHHGTLVLIWSATKGMATACTLHAMQEAEVDLDTRVATLWPEFAQCGKEHLTLGHVLSHRAGLCAVEDGSANILDRGSVVRAIEKQTPLLPVEAGPAYGPRVFGFVLDEILRRLTGGEALADYWRRVFARPLGLDLWIGLPQEMNTRVATILPPRAGKPAADDELFAKALLAPASLTQRAFSSLRGISGISAMNSPAIRAESIPSLGAIASAHALAKFYAMLASGGSWEGTIFFKKKTMEWMSTRLAQGFDAVLQREVSYSAGFMMDPLDGNGKKTRCLLGPSPDAFGHAGAGGSLGFADPERGIGFGYAMNQMASGVLPDGRCAALVRALYEEG